MKVLDLFSGIGGFSLGLERAGMETVAFCEFDKHARLVLEKHWPNVPIHEDVRQLDGHQYRGSVDVICGGFPCQDISTAGKQAGLGEETRSGLWSECSRLLGEARPKYAIFENVTALLSGDSGRWFQRVLWDISKVGYDAEWHCIPASELGAHHHRDRVWIIAYTQSAGDTKLEKTNRGWKGGHSGDDGKAEYVANANSKGLEGLRLKRALQEWKETNGHSGQGSQSPGWPWSLESSVCRIANGVPRRAHRLKQLGNAVVPQIPEIIGRAIMEAEA